MDLHSAYDRLTPPRAPSIAPEVHVRAYGCQACATQIELADRDEDLGAAEFQLRDWTCPGCGMHAHGRPMFAGRGVSGIPLWLGEQLWGTALLLEDPRLLDYLFEITRAALAIAADDEIAPADVENHARATLARIARGLAAPIVPPHPRLGGIEASWHPFMEHPHPGQTAVTFRVRPPTKAGMFAFEYRAPAGNAPLRLYTCYTVWRALPAGVEP